MLRSTPPSREATRTERARDRARRVAIHAPLAGGDTATSRSRRTGPCCDPRPPRGRRRRCPPRSPPGPGCDPRPPRGRRPARIGRRLRTACCDPRPPRGRRRFQELQNLDALVLRSTPPSREATTCSNAVRSEGGCDPRPPRGRRPPVQFGHVPEVRLRSTPPSREATPPNPRLPTETMLRSTPPSREATHDESARRLRSGVAIHAPLAGGDTSPHSGSPSLTSCDPRPPRGRRQTHITT